MNNVFAILVGSLLLSGAAELARPPIHRSGTITSADYPAAALRDRALGNTTIELTVDTAGRVIGCTVLSSSGHPSLDNTSCDLAQRRFRFAPALNAQGMPQQGVVTRTIRWTPPEPASPR